MSNDHADVRRVGERWAPDGSEQVIGTRLRKMRVARGLTQRELGSPRYTHAYVSTIESGRRTPSREAVQHFADKLEVGIEELLTGRPPDIESRLQLSLLEARVAISAGRFDEADGLLSGTARDAKRYGLLRLQARAEEIRGLRLYRDGRPEESLEHYRRAEYVLRGEPPTARVDAVDGTATCLDALGDVRYAIFLMESLLDEVERAGFRDPDALARIHASLVYFYLDAGLYAKAAESGAELEGLAPRLQDPVRVAQMHMNVTRLYLTEGRIEDAARSVGRAEDVYRNLALVTELGGAHLARGWLLSRKGDLGDARTELERALAIFQQTDDRADLTRTLNELARVERLEGNLARSRELLERSIALLGANDEPILGWAHRELGVLLLELDPDDAEKHLRAAIEIYERTEQTVDLTVTYRSLGDLLRARGDEASGAEAYRTGIMALEPAL